MVLVILAILAAILVPALLGYIDEARNKQYVLEARNIYMASQAVADEAYASNTFTKEDSTIKDLAALLADEDNIDRIESMADLDNIEVTAVTASTSSNVDAEHQPYVIATMTVTFTSQDGSTVTGAQLADGAWTIPADGVTPPKAE